VGGNGKGKSNVFAAMEFLLTGQTDDKLEEYVRDGCEKASVKGTLTLGKTTLVEVRRTIKSDGKSTASLVETEEGEEPRIVKGVTNVNSELEVMLGIDRDLAKNNIFVKQKHLDDILFTEPAKRARAWQRLCGMAEAEKIHKYLGQAISNMPDRQDFTAQILNCEERIRDMEISISESRNACSALEAKLAELPDETKTLVKIRELESCRQARSDLDGTSGRVDEFRSEVERLGVELETAKAELAGSKLDGEVLAQQIATVDVVLEQLGKASVLRGGIADLRKRIEHVEDDIAEYPSMNVPLAQEEYKELQKQAERLAADVAGYRAYCRMYQALLDSLSRSDLELVECPLCGSSIEDRDALITRLSVMIRENGGKAGELEQDKVLKEKAAYDAGAAITSHAAGLNNLQTQYSMLVKSLNESEEALKSYDVDEYDESHLRKVRQDLVADQARLAELTQKARTLEVQRGDAERAFRRALEMREALEAKAKAFPEDMDIPKQVSILSQLHADVTETKRMHAAERAKLTTQESDIENWKSSKADMERQAGVGSVYTKLEQSLERVRHWFHYSQGPHKLSMAVLNELTPGVNEFLSTLDGRFLVTPDPENLMFNIVFTDGREQPENPRPARRGSGGEKSSMATAFRLASYYMFAGQMGLLCLDEPTEYLDARKIDSFGRVVEQLKEISGKLDLQIFMATHRESIIPLFDSVIKL